MRLYNNEPVVPAAHSVTINGSGGRQKPPPPPKPRASLSSTGSLPDHAQEHLPIASMKKPQPPPKSAKPTSGKPTVPSKPAVAAKPAISAKPNWTRTGVGRSNSAGESSLTPITDGIVLTTESPHGHPYPLGRVHDAVGSRFDSSDCMSDTTSESGYNSPQSVGNSNTSISQTGVQNVEDSSDGVLWQSAISSGEFNDRRGQYYDSINDNRDISMERDPHKSTNTSNINMSADVKHHEHQSNTTVSEINQSQQRIIVCSKLTVNNAEVNQSYDGINSYSDQSNHGVDCDYDDAEDIYNECIADDDCDMESNSNYEPSGSYCDETDDLYVSVGDIPVPEGYSETTPPPLPPVVYSIPNKSSRKSLGNIHHIESLAEQPPVRRMSLDLDSPMLPSRTSEYNPKKTSGTMSKTKTLIRNLRKKRMPLQSVFRAKTNSTSSLTANNDRPVTVHVPCSPSNDDNISCTSSEVSSTSSHKSRPPPLPLSLPPVSRLKSGEYSSGDESTLTRSSDHSETKRKKKKPLLSKLKKNGFSKSLTDLRNFSTLSISTPKTSSPHYDSDEFDFSNTNPINGYQSSACDSHSIAERTSLASSDFPHSPSAPALGAFAQRGQVSQDWHRDYLKRILDNKELFSHDGSSEEFTVERRKEKRKSTPALTINARNLHRLTERFNTSMTKLQTSIQRASIQDPLARFRKADKPPSQPAHIDTSQDLRSNHDTNYCDDDYEDDFTDEEFFDDDENNCVNSWHTQPGEASGDNGDSDYEKPIEKHRPPAPQGTRQVAQVAPFTPSRDCPPPVPSTFPAAFRVRKPAIPTPVSPPSDKDRRPALHYKPNIASVIPTINSCDDEPNYIEPEPANIPKSPSYPDIKPKPPRSCSKNASPRPSRLPSRNSSNASDISIHLDLPETEAPLPPTHLSPFAQRKPMRIPPHQRNDTAEQIPTSATCRKTSEPAISPRLPPRNPPRLCTRDDSGPVASSVGVAALVSSLGGGLKKSGRPLPKVPPSGPPPAIPRAAQNMEKIKVTLSTPSAPAPSAPAPSPYKSPCPSMSSSSSTNSELSEYPWFFSSITRKLAEEYLTGVQAGTFLVREKNDVTRPYVLSLVFHHRIFNLHIRLRSDGKFALGNEKLDERTFDSVVSMINFYSKENLFLNGQYGGHCTLKSPPDMMES